MLGADCTVALWRVLRGCFVVGMKNGVVNVVKNEDKFKLKRIFRPSKEEISDIKFNPAGT